MSDDRLRDKLVRSLIGLAQSGVEALAARAGFDEPEPEPEPELRKRDKGRNAYIAGRRSRRNEGWSTPSGDGNTELGAAAKTMRGRSRDLKRNNRYARNALLQLASHASGLTPRSAIPVPEGASAAEREKIRGLNARVDSVFAQWSEGCMSDGAGDYMTAQLQATLGMFESGDSFTRKRVRRLSDGLIVPLALEVLEADFCDHTKNEVLKSGGWIIQGIEHSPIGMRDAYHLYRMHPDMALPGLPLNASSFDTVRVTASQVAHLYPKPFVRPQQVRGEPWLHAITRDLHDFAGYADAERVRLRSAATIMGIVESDDDWTPGDEDDEMPTGINALRNADGDVIERMRPGMIAYATNGAKIKFNSPPNSEGFQSYTSVDLHGQAAGVSMPYELFSGDLSGTNFSSIMFGMGGFWRMFDFVQLHAVIPLWARPVWKWFVELGAAAGSLPREAGPVRWVRKPWPVVDPIKQNKGRMIAVRAGADSLPNWIAETGKDPEDVMRDQVEIQRWARENGIVLDSIPSTSTSSGQVQTPLIYEPTPEEMGEGDAAVDSKNAKG
jgi:lambda family phage portal protein